MPPTPLHTLLEERLQSAKGLGWEMPTPPQPSLMKTGSEVAPAWFRFACLALRSLGIARG